MIKHGRHFISRLCSYGPINGWRVQAIKMICCLFISDLLKYVTMALMLSVATFCHFMPALWVHTLICCKWCRFHLFILAGSRAPAAASSAYEIHVCCECSSSTCDSSAQLTCQGPPALPIRAASCDHHVSRSPLFAPRQRLLSSPLISLLIGAEWFIYTESFLTQFPLRKFGMSLQ